MHKNLFWKLCVLLVCLFIFLGGCTRRPLRSNSDYIALESKIERVEKTATQEIRELQREISLQQEGLDRLKQVRVQPAPASTPSPAKKMEELYPEGRSRYLNKDYVGAAETFRYLVQNYPDHKLTPNTLYWLGECYYTQKQYDQAIARFERVIRDFPRSPKAPAALLKIAYSYSMLKQGNTAMTHLQSLLKKYPKSREAKMVREGKTIFKP